MLHWSRSGRLSPDRRHQPLGADLGGHLQTYRAAQARAAGSPQHADLSLANAGLAASGFRDVITGNNNFNGVAGFNAGVGFDLTTGWGTVDISTFANKFAGAATPPHPDPHPVADADPNADADADTD